MASFYKYKGNEMLQVGQEEADVAVLPIAEYNGLQNALRIVRDRAIQQIDKSQADEHGYRLVRADLRQYKHHREDKAWLITKSTPYSAKIEPREARYVIQKDLEEYYNFIESHFDSEDFVSASEDYRRKTFKDKDFLIQNNEDGRKMKQLFEKMNGIISFEISRIATNYSAGVYEVSYWATEII